MTGNAAFFDVDETLITAKSMFEFLRYYLARNGDKDGSAYERRAEALREMVRRGIRREEGNRKYYLNYAGSSAADVAAAGRDWYAEYRERPDAFVTAGVSALRRHRAAGERIVLVSGSFDAILNPIAADLGADAVLCSEPIVGGYGAYTGGVHVAMIGKAKAEAVAKHIAGLGVSPKDCHGYGDHSSDLDMLTVVGHPAVIGADPVLVEHARERGWPVLPATAGGRNER